MKNFFKILFGLHKRVRNRIGRRGAILLTYSTLLLGQGWALLTEQIQSTPALRILTSIIPTQVWGVIWIIAGIACILGAIHRKKKIQPTAFAATASIFTTWCIASTMAWIAEDVPLGWVAAIIWGSFAYKALVIIPSWREDDGS